MPPESDPNPEIKSPCIKVCRLDKNETCIGCFRSLEEIAIWIYLTDPEKQIVLENCEERKNQAAES